MTAHQPAVPVSATAYLTNELPRVWPDHELGMPRTSGALALFAGLVAAALLPESPLGLGLVVVGVLVAAAAVPTLLARLGVHEAAFGVLALFLLCFVAVRAAEWFVALCLLGAVGVGSFSLCSGQTFLNMILGGMSVFLAPLRGMGWIGRGLRNNVASRPAMHEVLSGLRAATLTIAVVLVFGALFASADAAFASLVPRLELDMLPARLIVGCATAGAAVGIAFLAAAPPRWDVLSPRTSRTVRPLEWTAPIAALDIMFATFVGVQLTVLFGGADHVLRTQGLTYAEYARSGFGQLVVVTLLTLLVVAAASRWAPRRTPQQRMTLRLLLGALCVLSLLIVASALYRLHLYEEAFGFTRLRLFMNVFETWLGVLLVLVLLAGVRLNGSWLPRGVVATAAAGLVVLGILNPDGFVAERNVERYRATGNVDVGYLQNLSPDAVPALNSLPEPMRSCVLASIEVAPDAGFAGWNLGRQRARAALETRPVDPGATC